MKKIILLLFSLVLVLGYANISLAVDKEEPVQAKTEVVQEETIIEEDEAVVEEEGCPHTWGEWFYDLTEHDDGSITCFRWCYCGAYEELDEQTYCDLGGQYENCDKGRHYWCDEADIRYCEVCGYTEER